MDKDADVLVVGAGPVGLLTALTLAQAGASVIVVEAEDAPAESPRAAVYFAPALIVLEELGLRAELDALGRRVSRFGHHVPSFDFHATISMAGLTGITYDYQLHVGQHELCKAAIRQLNRLGVPILFGHRVTEIAEDGAVVRTTLHTRDGRRSIDASWLIGADGARSTVRRLAGIEWQGFTWPNHFVATNVYCDMASLGYQYANMICDPDHGGVVAILNDGGLWRLTYSEDASLPAEGFRDRLPERYRGFIPDGVPYEVETATPYALHQRCSETLRKGRILLAGDAAHTTNPCGGLGLTSGMWTGVILADLLAAVLRGDAEGSALDRFSDERRRVFNEIISPGAIRNKIMMEEPDPAQRRRDMEAVIPLAEDPVTARLMMMFPFKVIGDPLREGSRWANRDPSDQAGVALAERRSQIAG